MNESEEIQLTKEVTEGNRHKQSWDTTVEPYFREKKKLLIKAFMEADSQNTDLLQAIKYQLNALEGMKEHFTHYIETGKMAAFSLEKSQNEENSDG